MDVPEGKEDKDVGSVSVGESSAGVAATLATRPEGRLRRRAIGAEMWKLQLGIWDDFDFGFRTGERQWGLP